MNPRYALAAVASMLVAGAASAQYVPATYQQPYCREFTKVVNVGGQAQSAYGQACRQPDGSWEIVSDDIPTNQPVQYYPQDNYVAYQPAPQPVAYYPPAPYYEPTYYRPPAAFSFSFSNWSPRRSHHAHGYGHGGRDRGRDWDRGRGNGRHDGNGRGRGRD